MIETMTGTGGEGAAGAAAEAGAGAGAETEEIDGDASFPANHVAGCHTLQTLPVGAEMFLGVGFTSTLFCSACRACAGVSQNGTGGALIPQHTVWWRCSRCLLESVVCVGLESVLCSWKSVLCVGLESVLCCWQGCCDQQIWSAHLATSHRLVQGTSCRPQHVAGRRGTLPCVGCTACMLVIMA